jgi:hypothetical protein
MVGAGDESGRMSAQEIAGEDMDAIGTALQHLKFGPADEVGMMTVRARAPIDAVKQQTRV